MTLKIQQLTPNIGAVIQGFNFNKPMTDDIKQEITNALLRYQVIFFKNQPITPTEHVNFAKQFGTLHVHPIFPHTKEEKEIVVLDNQQLDLTDNSIWHTDVTFIETPPLGSILSAKKVPTIGGDTVWSSGYAAWEALSPAYQHMLEGLTATHEFVNSFPLERFGNTPEAHRKWIQVQLENPPVVHPVVRTHPITGKKLIFVNEGFTSKINEMSPAESKSVLHFLYQHIAQPEFTIRWHWENNDIAFWDNRATQHYAVGDYPKSSHRVMHRATINGDRPV